MNVDDIIIRKWNRLAVVPDKVSCDFYDLLDKDAKTANEFKGEFMSQYSWAESEAGYLQRDRRN